MLLWACQPLKVSATSPPSVVQGAILRRAIGGRRRFIRKATVVTNPLSVASLVTFPNGPGAGTDNITGLPNNQAKGLGVVGTSVVQYYDDNVAPIKFKSGTGTSGAGIVSLYLVCSEDNSNWTNGINPSSSSDQSAKLTGMTALVPDVSVTIDATTYYFAEFSVYSVLGFMPTYWAVVVYNTSGAALDATAANFIAQHSLVSYA